MPCESWCNSFTCNLDPCINCGPTHGCSVAKYGHREEDASAQGQRARCATWCSKYTCTQKECLDCGIDKGCEGREPPSPPKPPPLPLLPPVSVMLHRRRPSDYFTYGGTIATNAWQDAEPIQIRGASWFGMETKACTIGGAEHLPIETIAEWLKERGFNAIRLPLAADAVLRPSHPCMLEVDREAVRNHNTEFGSLGYLDQVAEIARVAGQSGLLVLLDMHVLSAGKWPDGGVVAGGARQTLFNAWTRLANLLCDENDYWNVFAADLKNEPYGMRWAGGVGSWSQLATELGQHVHSLCPRWLIFVEGVGECADVRVDAECQHPSAGDAQDMHLHAGTWWGENLQGAASSPVHISDGDQPSAIGKIVYSPHTYGPSTHAQEQFRSSHFPSNMPHIWDTQFGYLARDKVAPVVIGEFGGLCDGPDATLQRALVAYMNQRGIGGFWWALNPESADTGGLIKSWAGGDIMTPEDLKLRIVSELPASHVPRTRERSPSQAAQTADAVGAGDDGSSPLQSTASAPPPPPVAVSPRISPSPSPSPPPPSSIAVRSIIAPNGPPFAYEFHKWPPLPPEPSPPPPHASFKYTRNGHNPVHHTATRSTHDGSDRLWIIPGVLSFSWESIPQLGVVLIGLAVFFCVCKATSSPRRPAQTIMDEPAPAKRPRKKKHAKDHGPRAVGASRRHWQHVPADADVEVPSSAAEAEEEADMDASEVDQYAQEVDASAKISAAAAVANLDALCAKLGRGGGMNDEEQGPGPIKSEAACDDVRRPAAKRGSSVSARAIAWD